MNLVPIDFSKVAECALSHAIKLASALHTEVFLLHVIEKEKEREDAQAKLNKIISETSKASLVKLTAIVKLGNIFDDIGGVAKEYKAQFIIMGTHGVKGMQHITGSYALKVITNSIVPFIVVQEKNIKDGYQNIVCPMDLSKETKQKIDLTVQVAKHFNSKVYLCSPHETDEFFVNTINRNLSFAEKQFKINGITCESIVFTEKGNFVKQTLHFAVKVNADLITIINGQEAGVHEYIAGTEERQFITNEAQIPVMCINPTSIAKEGSSLFFKN
jgi:nucleotide-binding universal stress UspA family protein